jgi:hypothetical protein
MTHLTRQQLVSFFGLLAPGDVEENARHPTVVQSLVIAKTARRDPADRLAQQDPEVDFVGANNSPCRCECSAHPVSIRRVNARGQVFKGDFARRLQRPEFEPLLVHRKRVGLYGPCPESDACGMQRALEVVQFPQGSVFVAEWHGDLRE